MAAITAEPTCYSTAFSNSPPEARVEVIPGLISIIVPVFNEARFIRRCLTNLRKSAPGAEIIVVDGGSSDETRDLAVGLCDQIIATVSNRGSQMNVGARASHGDTLWFLHADIEIPPECLSQIAGSLNNPKIAGGYFRI